jgi:hypothetical protein
MNPGTQIDDFSHVVSAHMLARLNLLVENLHHFLEFFLERYQLLCDVFRGDTIAIFNRDFAVLMARLSPEPVHILRSGRGKPVHGVALPRTGFLYGWLSPLKSIPSNVRKNLV